METGSTWHHGVRINTQACSENFQNSSVSLRKNPDLFFKWSLCTESEMLCYNLPTVTLCSAVVWERKHRNVTSPFHYWHYTLTTESESIALVGSIQNERFLMSQLCFPIFHPSPKCWRVLLRPMLGLSSRIQCSFCVRNCGRQTNRNVTVGRAKILQDSFKSQREKNLYLLSQHEN